MANYQYPYAFSGTEPEPIDLSHCNMPSVGGDDAPDAWAIWVAGREYYRAKAPGRIADWDAAFMTATQTGNFDVIEGWGDDAFRMFMQQFQQFAQQAKPGNANIANCQIDWNEWACAAFWFASLGVSERNVWIANVQNGGPYAPECAPTKSDRTYGTGPMTLPDLPQIPGSGQTQKPMPLWQKIAMGVGAVAIVGVAAIATTGGYKKNPVHKNAARSSAAKRGHKVRRGEELPIGQYKAMVADYAKTLRNRHQDEIQQMEWFSEDNVISDAAQMERRRREKAGTWN